MPVPAAPEAHRPPPDPQPGCEPLRGSGPTWPEDQEKPPLPETGKRHRRLLAGGAALAVLALVVVGWVYFPRGGSRNGPTATSPLDPNLLDPSSPLQAEAVKLADQLVEDFPDDVHALFVRGLILNKFVSRDEAAKCWQECVRRDPDFGEPYYWLGKELFKKGQYEEAVVSLRKAVQLGAPLPDVRIQLADALINLGRPEEAVAVLQEQVRVAPGVTAGFFYLAHTYWLLGRLDDAARYYRRALDLNPGCYQAWHGLARISQKRGESEKAGEYFRKCRQLQAKFFGGHQAKRREFDDADTLEGTLATAYTDAGRIYLKRRSDAAAETLWIRAAAVDPQNTQSRAALLDLYGRQGRLDAMLPLLEQLCRVQPDNPLHRFNLGMLHTTLGQVDRAEEAFTRLIEMAPQRAEGYAALADLYVRSGRKLPEAVELARKAVVLQPAAENYFLLSEACAKSGDRPGTLAAIARAIELDPGNPKYQRFQDQWADGR